MLIVTLCVVGSVLLIMQFLLRRFLSHPMTRLKNDVERLAAGEFNTTRLTNPRKEISNIITAFNSLADKLAHRDREVRRKTNSLEEVNAELSLEINERKLIEDALQQELDLNTSLAEVSGKMISSSGDIARVSRVVLDKIRQLTRSEHGYVGSIDPVTGGFVAHTLTEMLKNQCRLQEIDQRIVFPPEPDGSYPSLWGHSLNTRKPLITNDPPAHPSPKGIPEGNN